MKESYQQTQDRLSVQYILLSLLYFHMVASGQRTCCQYFGSGSHTCRAVDVDGFALLWILKTINALKLRIIMSEGSCEAGFGLNAHGGSSGSSAPSDSSYQGCAAEPLSAQNDIKTLRSEEGQAGCTGWVDYAERVVGQNSTKSRLRISWCTGRCSHKVSATTALCLHPIL